MQFLIILLQIFLPILYFISIIVVGFIWLPKAIEDLSYADPKLIVTITVWIIYAIGVTAKNHQMAGQTNNGTVHSR